MSRRVYPLWCACKKVSFRDEEEARSAIEAGRALGHYGATARAYKCPGHSCWHVATRGFHLAGLKTANRILAWHLLQRGAIDYVWMKAGSFGTSLKQARFDEARRELVRLGIVRRDAPYQGYLTALDRDALIRICEVGLTEYVAERESSR